MDKTRPGRWRKKPVTIEAVCLVPENAAEVLAWVNGNGGSAFMRGGPYGGSFAASVAIQTLEGTMWAEQGDWVIRGVAGEFYPCKPEIFEATYEPESGSDDGT